MTVDHFDPAWTVPPGMLFAEHVVELGLSQNAIAYRLDADREWLSMFTDGDAKLSPEMADKIAQLTGTDPQMWLHLEQRYRQDLADGKPIFGTPQHPHP
jgi:addiction module HigA family antidote